MGTLIQKNRPIETPLRESTDLIPNGYNFKILLLVFKLASLTSFFISSRIKRIFYLERGKKG